ncbi:unnamed protein product [Lactuca saligna]|uniref:Uncharacterized protein n=1 Tax=Lactuca saligna TaxID=75948 RepID=A0AA35ZVU3_LACSI|nr:unnamed protein product [Lactuca saligna]
MVVIVHEVSEKKRVRKQKDVNVDRTEVLEMVSDKNGGCGGDFWQIVVYFHFGLGFSTTKLTSSSPSSAGFFFFECTWKIPDNDGLLLPYTLFYIDAIEGERRLLSHSRPPATATKTKVLTFNFGFRLEFYQKKNSRSRLTSYRKSGGKK